jgi:hypothetical protein
MLLSHTSEKCSKVVILQDRKFILKNPNLHLDNVSRNVFNVYSRKIDLKKKKKYNAGDGRYKRFFIEQFFFNTVIFPKKFHSLLEQMLSVSYTRVSQREKLLYIIFIQMF